MSETAEETNKPKFEPLPVPVDVLSKVKEAVEIFKQQDLKVVLDLGCGEGRHAFYMAEQGFKVYAGDKSEKALQRAGRSALSLENCTVEFKQHDLLAIPFTSDFFDAVLGIQCMGHGTKTDLKSGVEEVRRVLRPGGFFFADFVGMNSQMKHRGKEVEPNTFLGAVKGEISILHHYTSEAELKEIFAGYASVKITVNEHAHTASGLVFDVWAEK